MINVRMPDGTVVQNVPDGITQQELLSMYEGYKKPDQTVDPRIQEWQKQVQAEHGFTPDPEIPVAPGVPEKPFIPQPLTQKQGTFTERVFGYSEPTGTGTSEQRLMPGTEPLNWLEKNPDIALATVASVLTPQASIPMALSQRLGPYLAPAVQNLPKIPGAFMGGAAGGTLKADPKSEISDILLEGLKSGGQMAAAEATGIAALPLLTKAFAPGLSSMTPEAGQLMQFAKDKKVPVTPEAFSPNVTAKLTQGGSDAFLPSRLVDDHYRKNAVVRFNQLMTEIPEEVGKIEGNSVITPKAIAELKTLFSARKEAGSELSEEFLKSVGSKSVNVKSTLSVLDKVKRTAVDDKLLDFVAKKTEQLKSGKVSGEELEAFLRQIGSVKPKSDKKFLTEIREAIKSDFEKSGAPMDLLEGSNKAFSENYALVGPKAVREMSEALARGDNPSMLTVKIFRGGNEGFVKALQAEAAKDGGKISKETWDSLNAQNLQNMIMNSTTESKRVMGFRVIDGTKLEKLLDNNKQVLEIALKDHPKTLEAMYNLARLAKASAQDMASFEKGWGETFKAGNLTAAIGGWFSNPVGLLVGSATAPLLAKSLMNPNGIAKKWLTTGYSPSVASQALKLGGREVFSED